MLCSKHSFQALQDPILKRGTLIARRDPAVLYLDGSFHLVYSSVERRHAQYTFYLDYTKSKDLTVWSKPKRLVNSKQGFSSPGTFIRTGNRWMLCAQTYPIEKHQDFGTEACRLWMLETDDLISWSAPVPMKPEGCSAEWACSPRQIDPFVVEHNKAFYCFYKTCGQIGLLVSKDLAHWEETHSQSPVFSRDQTPDKTEIENIHILKEHDEFVMFFSPTHIRRGIGIARSKDLFEWTFDTYIHFPRIPWANSGPTAPSLVDLRDEYGVWGMFYHAEIARPHDAEIGFAWSKDLVNWDIPMPL